MNGSSTSALMNDQLIHRDALTGLADRAQLDRALDGLVADGLVDPLPDGTFALPGLPPSQISTGAPISSRE